MWISQTYETMKSRCVYEIQTNTTLQTIQMIGGKTLGELGLNNLCPGTRACSGNGICNNGVYNNLIDIDWVFNIKAF